MFLLQTYNLISRIFKIISRNVEKYVERENEDYKS